MGKASQIFTRGRLFYALHAVRIRFGASRKAISTFEWAQKRQRFYLCQRQTTSLLIAYFKNLPAAEALNCIGNQ